MANDWQSTVAALYGSQGADLLSGAKSPNVTVSDKGFALDLFGDGSVVIGDPALVAKQHADGTLQSNGNGIDPNSVLGGFLSGFDWHNWIIWAVVLVCIVMGIGLVVRH